MLTRLRSSRPSSEHGASSRSPRATTRRRSPGAPREGIDALLVMWRDASAAKVAATERTARRSTSRRTVPRRFRAARRPVEARPAGTSCTRSTPRHHRRPGHGRARDPRGCDGRRHGRRPLRWRRSRLRDRARPCRAGVRVVAVEPEESAALRWRCGRCAGAVTPRHDRGRARRAVRRGAARALPALGVEVVLVTDDEIDARRSGRSTRARSSPRAAAPPPLRPYSPAVSRATESSSVVSGGNVSAEMASDILARP